MQNDTDNVKTALRSLRDQIQNIAEVLKAIRTQKDFVCDEPSSGILVVRDPSEMHANVMLAYRHLEDARMRIGKIIQAKEGGKSIYDK